MKIIQVKEVVENLKMDRVIIMEEKDRNDDRNYGNSYPCQSSHMNSNRRSNNDRSDS